MTAAADGPPPWPTWMQQVADVVATATRSQLSPWQLPQDGSTRQAAVLLLFGPGQGGTGDVLLIERAATMRSHAGQVAFPGGAVDPEDAGPQAAALREAWEETGLDPAGVDVVGSLPPLYLPPSRFEVTPVVGWWRQPSAVHARAVDEVARVVQVPLPELLDPANRFSTRLAVGDVGPGFEASGLFVWGFTALLLARVLQLAGLEQPWDEGLRREVPGAQMLASLRSAPPSPTDAGAPVTADPARGDGAVASRAQGAVPSGADGGVPS
ncbi:MAG TPA: CoA pyrophosphatase [Mycobacteriales bacterium]|nr:CoA pyrophosphatase [Mycobacteriales bacterium]